MDSRRKSGDSDGRAILKTIIKAVLIGGILLVLSVFLIKFVFVSEEKRVLKVIEDGEKALEAKDLDGCMKRLSYNYSDEYGLNYLQVKGFLEQFFQEFQEIEIQKEDLKIDVDKKKKEAQASINVRVIVNLQGQKGYLIGSSERPENIKMNFEKARTKWLVNKVEWPERLYYY